MFVEKCYKQIPSPVGAAGQIDPCRPYGAQIMVLVRFYKHDGPPDLILLGLTPYNSVRPLF